MKKVLHIKSSPRTGASVSRKLGESIVEKIVAKYAESTVKEKDLSAPAFPHLEEKHINAFFTPEENRTDEQKELTKTSDEAIAEVFDADIIVIEAPLYNFSITSTLKSWMDHIARAGVTFRYTENGPEGLVKDKKVYLAFTSGGVYSEGQMQAYDFVVPYLEKMLGFIGITDVSIVRAEGLAVPELQAEALQKGVESIAIA